MKKNKASDNTDKSLEDLRGEIDKADDRLLALLNERAKFVGSIPGAATAAASPTGSCSIHPLIAALVHGNGYERSPPRLLGPHHPAPTARMG